MDAILRKLLIALLLLVYIPARATVAFVQSAHNTQASGTSFTVTFGAATTTGNFLFCGVVDASSSPTAPTGGGGGTWTQVADSSTHVNAALFISQAVGTGSTTVTINVSSSSAANAICAEYSGVTATQDVTATTNNGASTSATSGSQTTVTNGDLIIAVSGNNASGTITAGPTNSFTEREGASGVANGTQDIFYADLIQSSAGAINTVWTTANVGWDASQGAFKATAGAAASSRMTLLGIGP